VTTLWYASAAIFVAVRLSAAPSPLVAADAADAGAAACVAAAEQDRLVDGRHRSGRRSVPGTVS
jgi:hypothetical protein